MSCRRHRKWDASKSMRQALEIVVLTHINIVRRAWAAIISANTPVLIRSAGATSVWENHWTGAERPHERDRCQRRNPVPTAMRTRTPAMATALLNPKTSDGEA